MKERVKNWLRSMYASEKENVEAQIANLKNVVASSESSEIISVAEEELVEFYEELEFIKEKLDELK